jgi:gamma-glutamyltranspeptidase/glutathione hydrolase
VATGAEDFDLHHVTSRSESTLAQSDLPDIEARVASADVAVLMRLIDAQDTLADAVTGSRVHATETGVEVEPGIDLSVGESWAKLGSIRAWPTRDLFFGGVHAVRLAADGRTEAIGDSRRGGVAALVT